MRRSAGDRRRRAHRAGAGQAALPRLHAAGGQDLRGLPARAVPRGAEASATPATRSAVAGGELSAEVHGPAGARAGRDQQAGLRQLLPDRLGLRPLRPRAGHPGHGPRLGRGLAGGLRPVPEPRLPAGIRPALRAVPGREPPRGARHRHRLLPAAPRRGDPVRQGEVRHGERGPDRHVRHAGGAGGDPRRGPGPGHAHPPGRRRRGPGARRAENHPRRRPWKRATT